MVVLDFKQKKVWAPHPVHGFILGEITDIGSDSITVQPYGERSKPLTAPYDSVFPAEEDDMKDVDDNCKNFFIF